jgi:endonuclease-8
MPEGHTIHRLARDQNESLAGPRLRVSSPQGRFRQEAKRIDCLSLKTVEAAGKHLFYHFSRGPVLHVHLGLFGKFRTHDNPPPAPRGAVRGRFESKEKTVDLNGPNQCELIDREEYATILYRLGADPLRADARPERAWARIRASKAPIGLLLMDQSVIAGIGNIYRTELLHLIGVDPRTPGNAISKRQFTKLWKLAVALLNLGVKHNRIITIDAKTLPKNVANVPRKKLFRIFKKPACPTCAGDVDRFTMAGRKVFSCARCQPALTHREPKLRLSSTAGASGGATPQPRRSSRGRRRG